MLISLNTECKQYFPANFFVGLHYLKKLLQDNVHTCAKVRITLASYCSWKYHKNSSGDEIANVNFFTTTSHNTSKYNPLLNIQHNTGREWVWPHGISAPLQPRPICCNEVRF